jgi:hypothetical protein
MEVANGSVIRTNTVTMCPDCHCVDKDADADDIINHNDDPFIKRGMSEIDHLLARFGMRK